MASFLITGKLVKLNTKVYKSNWEISMTNMNQQLSHFHNMQARYQHTQMMNIILRQKGNVWGFQDWISLGLATTWSFSAAIILIFPTGLLVTVDGVIFAA